MILLLSSPKRWLKLLSVPVLATDLDLSHTVFLQEAFLAIYLRYSGHTGQNTAKTNVQGTLASKWEIEMWWQPVFLTQRPRLPIRPQYIMGSISHHHRAITQEF